MALATLRPTLPALTAPVVTSTVVNTANSAILTVPMFRVTETQRVWIIPFYQLAMNVGVMQDLLVWIVKQTLMIVMKWIVTMEHVWME